MVYCRDCGEFFEYEDAKITDNYVPYGMTEVKESTSVECPHCYSSNLEFDVRLVTCSKCGCNVPDCDTYIRDGDYICYDCEYEEV